MAPSLDVGILGATGTVGERLVALVAGHPWFRLREVAASEGSAGDRLGDRLVDVDADEVGDAAHLVLSSPGERLSSPLLLSALPSGPARELEPELAARGHLVVSNASAFRQDPRVPLVIPEVNPEHLALVPEQPWAGGLVTNPNCVVAGTALALAPLHDAFGLETVVATTFQAISGAGRPGPAAADLTDNVVPFIAGEEEKMGPEIRKILGTRETPASVRVSATASRVPVRHGHLVALSLGFREAAGPDEVREALAGFTSPVAQEGLPLAPEHPVVVLEGEDRPQPRKDRDRGRGMTVSVGRIRPCPVHDVKLLVLSHNLIRGAAGAALLNAELCAARGWVEDRLPEPDA